ncbi:MAG: hypothetical protein U9R34_08480 [Nanoarchaeota archaeon]|nr:hypothetical protein [Nanoarchaeota archaeon]
MVILGSSKKLELLKSKIGNIDIKLLNSFDNIKYDIHNIYRWIDYLNTVIEGQNKTIYGQSSTINYLQIAIEEIPKNKEDIRKMIDEYYSIQPFAVKISELIKRIEVLEANNVRIEHVDAIKNRIKQLIYDYPVVVEALDDLKVRVRAIEKNKKQINNKQEYEREAPERQYTRPKLQEKIIKSVARASKEYVKNLILSLIEKYEEISALKIREIIVEEQGIVSKSSFYRMLEELEKEKSIDMVRIGKEKHYHASKVVQQNFDKI